jgi:hypothetical protein
LNDYPEHDKLHKIHEQSQAIGEFLEWLQWEKKWQIIENVGYWDWAEPINVFRRGERYGPPTPKGATGYRWVRRCSGQGVDHNRDHGCIEQPHWCYDNPYDYGHYRMLYVDVRPRGSTNEWLAEFFEIDLDKIEKEKRAMIESMRRAS